MISLHVLIADAHSCSRIGIRAILADFNQIAPINEVRNRKELLLSLSKSLPDVLIFDYLPEHFFSVDDIVEIKRMYPRLTIVIITSDNNRTNLYRCIDLGIKNFLTKECDEDEILGAVMAAAKGEKFFCAKIVDMILEKHINPDDETCAPTMLSQREIQIVKLTVTGRTSKDVAQKLNLSYHTVNTHRKNIMKKLGLKSSQELVMFAIRFGLISSKE